jgi:hypothetical protein
MLSRFNNPFGAALAVILALFFPVVYTLAEIRTRRIMRKQREQLQRGFASPNYRPIDHVHEIDFHRSGIVVTDRGAIFARCCIAGCEEGVFIGQNMAAAWKILPPERPREAAELFLGRVRW